MTHRYLAIGPFRSSQLERGDWRVFVNPRPGDWTVDVWLIHRIGEKTYNATVKNSQVKLSEVKEGDTLAEPFLRLHGDVWQLIIDAMAENTPPTKKEAIDAELKATIYHLEDLRSLAFKKRQ